MKWSLSKFRVGDVVEVRSKEEVLATLDENGNIDGLPFMPEMLQYCGQRLLVSAVAHKSCDTVRKTWKGRRLQTTVHLKGARCDGSQHGGCQANCNLFWKDEWLRPVVSRGFRPEESFRERKQGALKGVTESQLIANTKVPSRAQLDEPIYSCQATKHYDATEPLQWWDPRQYVYDIITGNQSVGRVLCVIWLAFLRWLLRKIPFGYRVSKCFVDAMHKWLSGRPTPAVQGHIVHGSPTPTGRSDLQSGEYVRIKSLIEIENTLDSTSKNRGMFFDWEMIPYCDKVFKVQSRVTKIIDESTGRMLHMRQPCIILDGVVCKSQYNASRLLCPRAIPPYWREIWLERVEPDQEPKRAPAAYNMILNTRNN